MPHPRMAERRFVLEPMAELAPGLRHPVSQATMLELLGRVSRTARGEMAEPGKRAGRWSGTRLRSTHSRTRRAPSVEVEETA